MTVFLSQHDNSVTTNPINISASDKMFIEEDLFRYQKSLWKTIWPQGLPEYVKAIKWQNKNKHTIQNKVFNLIFYFKFGFLVHNWKVKKVSLIFKLKGGFFLHFSFNCKQVDSATEVVFLKMKTWRLIWNKFTLANIAHYFPSSYTKSWGWELNTLKAFY